jgi:hypothetical protein
MQPSNNAAYAYQIPSNRQFFAKPNDTDIIVSKTEQATTESGRLHSVTVFFRTSPEEADALKKSGKIHSNQKTIDDFKTLLQLMGYDRLTVEKGLLQIRKVVVTSRAGIRETTRPPEVQERGKNTGNKFLRSTSVKNIARTGELISQKVKDTATIAFGNLPIPANTFEGLIKEKQSTGTIKLVDENNKPHKYKPTYDITQINIHKPREAQSGASSNAAKVVATTTTTTSTDSPVSTPSAAAPDGTFAEHAQQQGRKQPAQIGRKSKPLPKRPTIRHQQESPVKNNAVTSRSAEKQDTKLISSADLHLPELPDDE